ncbi:MAG: hypothetical protein E2O53_00355 [Gammaproteobacteria bacterium]|nr:MAG: hypothetical protein E2O53_00355 [Gammaproteobacteria bacterium]
MTDAEQPAEKDLVGIKGWLLLDAILLALRTAFLLGIVSWGIQWGDISDVTERLIWILALTVFLVGLYLLIVVRRPITRYFDNPQSPYHTMSSISLKFPSAKSSSLSFVWRISSLVGNGSSSSGGTLSRFSTKSFLIFSLTPFIVVFDITY